jgi:hypothetical protein
VWQKIKTVLAENNQDENDENLLITEQDFIEAQNRLEDLNQKLIP